MPKHISKDIKEAILKRYKEGPITINQLSLEFGVSAPSIIKILNFYRVKRYTKVQLFSPQLNERFFQEIDSEEKAYFLGLIISDGCIYKKGDKQNILSITLQEEDKYILEKFVKIINSNKQVTSDGRGCSEINILSDLIVSDLEQYGLTENKSLHTIFPKNIRKEFYPHLIRGLIDGDGSFAFYARPNRKSHTKNISLCQGNEQFLKDVVSFLHQEIDTSLINLYKEKDNLWSIRYGSKEDIKKLSIYLYNTATIYLKRKKKICDKIMEEILSYDGNTEITIQGKTYQYCKAQEMKL